ncbi:MAG: HAMP domain-containing protein [Gammaproteobacteria bacterium]|nr:HAMP domain-containing protein [Gammaproteobacteria bacterium]
MNSKLEFRLLNYFLLIAFATILIGIEFYFELGSKQGQQIDYSTTQPLDNLRNKILIMFAVLSIVVAIVLTMFIKNITSPLCKMAIVARHINEGDLTQSVVIDNHDEIGEVGLAINELANNLHEVASFTSATANETLVNLKHLQGLVADNPEIATTINSIENNLLSIKSFVNSFKLLDTDITNA